MGKRITTIRECKVVKTKVGNNTLFFVDLVPKASAYSQGKFIENSDKTLKLFKSKNEAIKIAKKVCK